MRKQFNQRRCTSALLENETDPDSRKRSIRSRPWRWCDSCCCDASCASNPIHHRSDCTEPLLYPSVYRSVGGIEGNVTQSFAKWLAGTWKNKKVGTLRQSVHRSQRDHTWVSLAERLLSNGGIPSSCIKLIKRLLDDSVELATDFSTKSFIFFFFFFFQLICWSPSSSSRIFFLADFFLDCFRGSGTP